MVYYREKYDIVIIVAIKGAGPAEVDISAIIGYNVLES